MEASDDESSDLDALRFDSFWLLVRPETVARFLLDEGTSFALSFSVLMTVVLLL